MPEIHTRMLELAKEALSEQERHVAEVRSRAVAVLSVGTFVAGLLGKSALAGARPTGVAVWLAIAVAGAGLLLFGRSMLVLLGVRRMTFALDPVRTYGWLELAGVTAQPAVDFELANRLAAAHGRNAVAILAVERALHRSLFGLTVLIVGTAVQSALGS